MITRFFICFFAVLLCVSCTSKVSVGTSTFVDVKKLPDGFFQSDSFVVLPVKEQQSLLSKELTQKIEKYLLSRGYGVVAIETAQKAKYALLFNCATQSSEKIISVPKYIPGETTTTSSNVYSTKGYVEREESTSQASGTTVYVPEQITITATKLVVEVFNLDDMKEKETPSPIWEGRSAVFGEDVRVGIDYLVVAVFKHFGKSTGKNLFFDIKDDDDEIQMLRQQVSVILKNIKKKELCY